MMFGKVQKSKTIFGRDLKQILLVAGSLITYCCVTLVTITKSSIWFDEAFSAYMTRFNWFDIAKYTANDVHPPLYYWLLSAWTSLFGTTELTIRTMSVFFGCIALVFGYLILKRLFNSKTANLGLFLMAISPMFVRYGQEARMYTLVTAIALAATYVLIIATKSKKKLPWVIYGILVSLGMWTHYFTALVWLSHWVWRAIETNKTNPKNKRLKAFFSPEWMLAHFVAIGVYLPWLPFFVYQVVVVQAFGFWIPPVTPDTVINYLTNVVYYQDVDKVNGWLSAAIIFAVAIVVIMTVRAYRSMSNELKKSFRLILTFALAPAVILFFVSMPPFRSSFIDRYLVPSSLGISMVAAIAVTNCKKMFDERQKNILSMMIVALFAIGISNVYYWGNYNKNTSHWNGSRDIIQLVQSKSTDGEPIIINSPYLFYEEIFYANDNNPVVLIDPEKYQYGSTDMIKYNDQFKIKKIDGSIDYYTNKHKTFWYIGYSSEGKLEAPYSNWRAVRTVEIKDKVSSDPAYIATEYTVK